MTWSDAARAAALEARRMHAKAKGKGGYASISPAHAKFVTSKDYRDNLAGSLHALRTQGLTNTADRRVPRMAAFATKVRNQQRSLDRMKKAFDALTRPKGTSTNRPHPGFRQQTNMWTNVNATNPYFKTRGY